MNRFPQVVLCGSFRRDFPGLQLVYQALLDRGALVLAPRLDRPLGERIVRKGDPSSEFVMLEGDHGKPTEIERRHVAAIEFADFVWLHAPDGYVGRSVAFELGVAHAAGIPVYSLAVPHDLALAGFVMVVGSYDAAFMLARTGRGVPRTLPALQVFFSQLSQERGYDRETAIMALLGCVEGELAREFNIELGAKPRIARAPRKDDEFADLLLQVVHLANRDGYDLHTIITQKIAKYPPVCK